MKLGKLAARLMAGLTLGAALTVPALADHDRYPSNGYYGNRGGAGLVLFEHGEFRGSALPVNSAIPNMSDYRFNDKASSFQVRSGRWEVCSDGNFRGQCRLLEASAGALSYIGMTDKISSVRPAGYGYDRNDGRWGDRNRPDYGNPGYAGGRGADIVLFEHSDFRGRSFPLDGDIPSLYQTGLNDKVSSIAINRGRWQVCTDGYFRGECRILDRSISGLTYIRLNDKITSIRRVGW